MTIFLIEITAAVLAFAYRAKVRLKIHIGSNLTFKFSTSF